MCGKPRKNMTEAERYDVRLESSKMSHAKSRREAWHGKHATPLRTSINPPPSLDALRDAYQRRNESCESMIRLGSMLEDIEAAHGVGYELVPMGEEVYNMEYDAPWQTGIRGFLKDAPDLLAVYKTLMRYKKLSADFRKAIGLHDPSPATLVFDGPDEPWLLPVRKCAHEILSDCGGAFRELAKRIADFGQQSGLRPEPRKPPQPYTNPRKGNRSAMCAEPCLGAAVGVRGKLPPADVGRRRDA